jgi:hypothetical protein
MIKNLPEKMKLLDNFLLWDLRESDGKYKKVPVHPVKGTMCAASYNNCVSFDEAVSRAKQHKVSGIGFYLRPEDNITCIDFDNVLDDDGNLFPKYERIQEHIEALGSYTERSQSKRGLHVFVIGKPPGSSTRKATSAFPTEIYHHSRYIAVTGDVWQGFSSLREAQEAINDLYNEVFQPEPELVKTDNTMYHVSAGRSDEKILQILSNAANAPKFQALYSGGGSSEDRSADDMALASIIAFYTQDCAQIERIMRSSSIAREKWDSHKTYLSGTIQKAIKSIKNFFDWDDSERREREFHDRQKNKSYDSGNPDLPENAIQKSEAQPPAPKKRRSNAEKIADAELYLNTNYLLYKNVVNGFVYVAPKDGGEYIQLSDHERSSLFLEMQRCGIDISDQIFDHLLKSDFVRQVNPVNDFFHSLPEWDGVDHVSIYLANTIVPVSSAQRDKDWYFIRKWLVGIPGCALSKDDVNDLCLIFKGAQGIGKSTWFKNLLPESLSEYHITFDVSDRTTDTGMTICSSLICNMDELSDLSRRDDSEIKKLISQKTFKIRKPYDRLPGLYYRYASFCGSVNDDTFLKDQTGSRRYIVVNVERFNFDAIKLYDKTKLWAQIYHLYKSGFEFWLTQEENAEVSRRNSVYMVTNPEEELLLARFEPGTKDDYTHRMNATELLQFLDIKKVDARSIKAMSQALQKHYFKQINIRIKGKGVPRRAYLLKELPKEVYAYEMDG